MSFRGPKLKLERAKHHITNLVAVATEFCNSTPFDYEVLHDANTRQRSLVTVVDKAIPDEIPLIIGDAVHNLRSALDHLTWDVLRPFNPLPDKVQFPFCRKAENFESVLRNRQIEIAGEKIAQKFRDLKPYPGGNDVLYGLHVLDVADKHELIVPVISWIAFDRFDLREFDPDAPPIVETKIKFDLARGKPIVSWPYDPAKRWIDPHWKKQVDCALQITFRKDLPFGGKNVGPALRSMALAVADAIAAFEH